MPYSEWLTRLPPHWLQGDWAGGVIAALADEIDELTAEMTAARLAFMPERAALGATRDALVKIGQERGLERGPTESDAAYALRLREAWETLPRMGSHKALLEQVKIAGFDSGACNIVQRSGRRTRLDGSGNLVIVDGPIWTFSARAPRAYAQFGLFFTAPQPSMTWNSSTGYSADAAKLHRIAKRWRPAKAEFMGTVIVNSGVMWGWPASLTWGSFVYGGSSTYLPP